MNIVSFLYELLFDPKRKKRRRNNPELFHTDDFLRPDYPNIRACPKCNIQAKTNKEAAKIFGLRNIKGFTSIQSWCIKCRNSKDDKSLKQKQGEIDI
tara:strand:+ start:42 stop:332 length:291 start_codon:yes stop_codon:yes gene_type:complete